MKGLALSTVMAAGIGFLSNAFADGQLDLLQSNLTDLQSEKALILAASAKKSAYNRVKYSGRTFVFSPRVNKWWAYQDGKLIRSGRASGGKNYCSDVKRACRTPRGVFTVNRKGGPNCRSSKYPLGRGGARMDYCIFFSRSYAIHGSNHVPNYNASHGCIRVSPAAARWLNRSFLRSGDRVIVKPY